MRIALVCSEVVRESGHGRYMLELARRLAARHEVHVYSHLYEPVPGVSHHRVSAHLGINLLRVYSFFLGASLRLAFRRYDVIHTIGGCAWQRDVVTAQFCQRAWGARLSESALAELGGAGFAERLTRRLRRLYHQLYWRMCDWLEAPAFRSGPNKRLIAVSGRVKDELVEDYGAAPDGVKVVFNGVEPTDFDAEALAPLRAAARSSLGFAPEDCVLLFVGDFYRKGLQQVLAALARLERPAVRLLVVGRGEIAAFTREAETLGVAGRVRFVGFQRDVRPYFACADLFVFPTRYEPFGMVITEAMAAGLPVVTTRQAGAAEVITDGRDGCLIDDPDDVGALASTLDGLIADPARRAAMGERARRTAKTVDWEYVACETEAVYAELLAARANPAAEAGRPT